MSAVPVQIWGSLQPHASKQIITEEGGLSDHRDDGLRTS